MATCCFVSPNSRSEVKQSALGRHMLRCVMRTPTSSNRTFTAKEKDTKWRFESRLPASPVSIILLLPPYPSVSLPSAPGQPVSRNPAPWKFLQLLSVMVLCRQLSAGLLRDGPFGMLVWTLMYLSGRSRRNVVLR